jgi:hypothetical protein
MMAVWHQPRSRGREAIFRLVAGYATGVRERKPLAFLQAVIDDSASEIGDKRLFLAGYCNDAESWARFADAWRAELQSGKQIDHLHTVEAMRLRGQFEGWSEPERDEKLRDMARVARHFKPLSFHVSVGRSEYFDSVKPLMPRGMSPHFVSCFSVVSMLTRYAATAGGGNKVEFIFDKQNGVEDDIALFFDFMARNLPKEARKLLSGNPRFESDLDFLPLQAADLLAWDLRRNHEDFGTWERNHRGWSLPNPKGHLTTDIDPLLPGWAKSFEQMPQLQVLQTKSQWRNFKSNLRRARANGYVPPHGTRWKNLKATIRNLMACAWNRLRGRA